MGHWGDYVDKSKTYLHTFWGKNVEKRTRENVDKMKIK